MPGSLVCGLPGVTGGKFVRGACSHCNCLNTNFEARESSNIFQGKFWSLRQEVKLVGPVSWIYFVFIYMGFLRRSLFRITLL